MSEVLVSLTEESCHGLIATAVTAESSRIKIDGLLCLEKEIGDR